VCVLCEKSKIKKNRNRKSFGFRNVIIFLYSVVRCHRKYVELEACVFTMDFLFLIERIQN